MVNDGNDQHGSQFLITLSEALDYLDGVHTVFGQVAEGLIPIFFHSLLFRFSVNPRRVTN